MAPIANQVRPGISEIQPYVPGLTDDELKRQYGLQRIVKLNANENALGPSPLALQAVREELSTLHHYPDGSSGLLREVIADFHHMTASQVMVGNGSDDLIKLLSETFLDPGDEVIMPIPSFSQYAFGAAIMGAKVHHVPLRENFSYDVKAMLAAVTSRTKLIYACSPNNPTATLLTMEQVQQLLEGMPSSAVLVLDLAYNDYASNPNRVTETTSLFDDPRVVCLHTFSKLYGLAGLRVGYGLASEEVWEFVNRVREPFNVNRVAQRAAVAALGDEAHRQASRVHAVQSREFYLEQAHRLGIQAVPGEANFVLLHTGDGQQTMAALMTYGVMVRAGFPGVEEYIRVTFGTEEENNICIESLEKVLHL